MFLSGERSSEKISSKRPDGLRPWDPSIQEAGVQEINSGPSWSTQQNLVKGKRGERGPGRGVAKLGLKTTVFEDPQILTTSQEQIMI